MAETPAAPNSPAPLAKTMDNIVALCRRRGFIWQSSEIYGGINGFWDYGPLGTQLKRNLKDAWWKDIVTNSANGPDGKQLDVVGVDCTIIMNPKVWIASGHAGGFNDPMVDCTVSKKRFRADHAWVVGFDRPIAIRAREMFREEVLSEELEQHNETKARIKDLGLMEKTANNLDLPVHEREKAQSQFDELAAELLSELGRPFYENEIIRNFNAFSNRILTPMVMIAIEAGSKEEAIVLARNALTKKQQASFLNEEPIIGAWNQAARPSYIPRRSPATQTDSLTEPRQFNLMFETNVGAVQNEDSKAWLRPETAQGIFAEFWNVVDTSRVKVPFGIAQIGKAFRNEVTPRNFTFRSREFEQMEIEFFIKPETAREWYQYWRDARFNWWQKIGLAGDNLQLREHDKDELSHYAKEGAGVCDVEYRFPFTSPGYGELEGIAHRADFDLKAHANACGKGDKMMYFDQEMQVKLQGQGLPKEEINKQSRYFPHVIEPSAGADRGVLALLCEAFTPDANRPSGVFMKFNPRMAPIKAGIFPLVNKEGMPEVAEKLYRDLRKKMVVDYDEKQTIGKRYARMDEAGTPFCITIDGDTMSNQTVTVRDRDTATQQKISLDKVEGFLAEKIGE
jgi:glycyl-tRNA synthetase (class II)